MGAGGQATVTTASVCCGAFVRCCADAMRRTKARRNAPSLSFAQTYRRRMSNEPDIVLCDFFAHSSLRVGIKQEELAVGDPVSGSGAAERLFNQRRGHRKTDGEAHCGPGLLGQGERFVASDHRLL